MQHWLVRTEPDEFSIDDLQRVGVEPWSGVRNYQARNHLRAMRRGDPVLIYHSSCAVPAVVGLAEVAAEAYPDPLQFDRRSDYHDPRSRREEPRWSAVDVRYVRTLAHPVTLEALKADPRLEGFLLLARGNRLSVLPVTPAQFRRILSHEKKGAA